jgi:8-oxo-dGTP pyrophosphatase MutT (NUDIX family)
MNPNLAREALRRALARPLPGIASHRLVLPPGYLRETIPEGERVVEASVLLALQREERSGRIVFPLILRPHGIDPHAGQVGLPGGARHPGEDPARCALREAEEEIGLDPGRVDVLGVLTPITIPVSGYRVETVVGWVKGNPRYVLQEREVMRILFAEPSRLAREGAAFSVTIVRSGEDTRFPAYGVEDQKVWGATALILSEFFAIWRSISLS